jgi:hypothetical protein
MYVWVFQRAYSGVHMYGALDGYLCKIKSVLQIFITPEVIIYIEPNNLQAESNTTDEQI